MNKTKHSSKPRQNEVGKKGSSSRDSGAQGATERTTSSVRSRDPQAKVDARKQKDSTSREILNAETAQG